MNPRVDDYIAESDKWPDEMIRLRPILLGRGLSEQIKWRKPTYTLDDRNIAIFQEMNDYLALMFFKGALLDDAEGVLHDQGPNSRSARRMQFTSVDEVDRMEGTIAAYIDQAIEVERAGLTVAPAPELVLADELRARLTEDPALESAFESLTPGRQREYNLYISGAKRADTRTARVDKCVPIIRAGKGLRDR